MGCPIGLDKIHCQGETGARGLMSPCYLPLPCGASAVIGQVASRFAPWGNNFFTFPLSFKGEGDKGGEL